MTTPTATELLARKAHRTLEPLHIVVYFAPEAGELFAGIGVRGGMRPYFASRAAALGRVPPEVVIATFYNFAPWTVHKAIPGVWEATTPEQAVHTRVEVADRALRRILGDDVVGSDEMAEAASLIREAAGAIAGDVAGRPLFAGHAALPWPDPPHLQLWHGQTLLREHRGDGHVAALLVTGLDPVEALLTHLATGDGLPEPIVRATRGWTDEEYDTARARLRERGVLDDAGRLTDAGAALREEVEHRTDRAATAPWHQLGEERTQRLRELARPWSTAIVAEIFGR